MGSVDRVDDRKFRVNFTGDGAAKLKERVKDKLKEFMGDYTDDTLVEYVIVLLRNGRSKEEARNELNVFLGEDSHSFISWLWDHLASNLDLYVHPRESNTHEMPKIKPISMEKTETDESHPMNYVSEREKSNTLPKNRLSRQWKGLVRDATEPASLRSCVVDNIHFEEDTHQKVNRAKRSHSPRPSGQRKRSRPDERQMKREAVSQASINAPRRLLQFAVRDAVGTPRPSSLSREPSLKRLRSVVSTTSGDSLLVDRPRRLQSVARVPNPMATVIKAVAEAAEDVVRVKSSGSVFDRLGHGMDVSETAEQVEEFSEGVEEDGEYGHFNHMQEQTTFSSIAKTDYSGEYTGNMSVLEGETGLASDSMSDNEVYDDVNVIGRRAIDVSQTGTSSENNVDDSLMVQYNVAKNADDGLRKTRNKDQDQPVVAANNSRKIVNISVNVNTWKPPNYKESREFAELDSRKIVQESEAAAGRSGVRLMKENNKPQNAKPAVHIQNESQKALASAPGLYTAGRPSEDADSRTIFVSNVHFAASKDSLSRHFNKFGEVLKVVIVTDAATGQPKGSAYVEFMRKEAADNALSLDGTSFMSRILKVVKRSSAHQEAAPVMSWPRIIRGSPYAATRFTRVAYPRGIPGAFRPHLAVKPGARSMQWKRDAQSTQASNVTSGPGNSVPSPTARSLTYIRTEPKQDGNPGTT